MSGAVVFDGRVALVTGAGGGLGRDYALRLAERGAKVVVNDLGVSGAGVGASASAADAVVAEIRAAGGEAVASYASVADRAGGAAIVRTALDAFGRLDIYVHNAGFLRNGRFEALTDADIDTIVDVHLKSGFYVGQPAFQAMKANGYGRFVFAGSASALFGHAWQANYAAAKAGLVGLSNVIALEGEPHGIRSNVLIPTATSRLAEQMGEGFRELPRFAQGVDLQRYRFALAPRFTSPLVLYLASEACASTHAIYSHCCGRYARVDVAAAEGWIAPGEVPPSPEQLAAHWREIEDRTRDHQFMTNYDELAAVVAARQALNIADKA